MKIPITDLGAAIRCLRARLELTQEEFAFRFGAKTNSAVSRWETGERMPSQAALQLMNQAADGYPEAGPISTALLRPDLIEKRDGLAEAIRSVRESLGLNQENFAFKLLVASHSSISRYEHGVDVPPKPILVLLHRLAKGLPEQDIIADALGRPDLIEESGEIDLSDITKPEAEFLSRMLAFHRSASPSDIQVVERVAETLIGTVSRRGMSGHGTASRGRAGQASDRAAESAPPPALPPARDHAHALELRAAEILRDLPEFQGEAS